MTKSGVTHQAIVVTDAIILLAVVLLAIAATTDGCLDVFLLERACQYCLFSIVIFTANALADTWNASHALFTANAVELAALSTLTVAVLH